MQLVKLGFVVIEILVALQINNWNKTKKSNDLKQNYYQQILVDLEIDKNYAEYVTNSLDSSLTKYNNYNETSKDPDLPFSEIFQNILKNEIGNLPLQFESTTIKSLISNGEIKLLDSELLNNLTVYNGTDYKMGKNPAP